MEVVIGLVDRISELQLKNEEVESLGNYILDRVVDEIIGSWENLINTKLNSSRVEYKSAIYSDRPDFKTAIIGLSARQSRLAMMIEEGIGSFDEKVGFGKSNKKKQKKDGGWYLTIPFRHATSESIMSSILAGSNITAIDFMKSGGTLNRNNMSEPFNEINTHRIQLNTGSILTYQHKAPIHEGMHRRNIASTEKEKRGGYYTFRRVSDKSDDSSWIHPGLSSMKLMDEALDSANIPIVVDNAFNDWANLKL